MSQRETIREAFLQYLREDTPVDPQGLADGTELYRQLRLDSVDFVGVVMRMEGRFRVRLSQKEIARLGTVGELIDLVEAKCRVPAAA
jgi:acyl carrier protein